MIHTADISIFPTKELFDAFINLPDTHWIPEKKIFLNTRYSRNGLTLSAKTINTPSFGSYQIRITKLNLSKLMMEDEHVCLITAEQMAGVEQRFDELILDFGIGLPLLNDWSMTRCDYCMNIKTPYVKEYIELLQKSNIPAAHRLPYNQHRNYVHQKGSLYLVSGARKKRNRSVTINFYDKQLEMIHSSNRNFTAEQIDKAKDVLRLEVQCFKSKIHALLKSGKYDVHRNSLVDFMQPSMSYDIIMCYLNRISKAAPFLRNPEAHAEINKLHCRTQKKELLHSIIDSIAKQRGSLSKTRQIFTTEGILSADKFDEYINYLAIHNINAVTISRNRTIKGKKRSEGLDAIQNLLYSSFWYDYMGLEQ